MRRRPEEATVEAAELWFVRHGLPYFVDSEREAARRGMAPARLLTILAGAALLGVAAGVLVGWLLDPSLGVATGMVTAAAVAGVYAATTLRMTAMARWAVTRTLASLGLLFPLVTRALPLLLVFVMFLFINAEVWQVGAALDGGVLWVTVMLFAGLAVAFLLARLPEELDAVADEVEGDRLVTLTRGTPLQKAAEQMVESGGGAPVRLAEDASVRGFQKANLVVVLLVAQIVQVFLLSLSVLAFFLAFGAVAMKDSVVQSWIGDQQLHPWHVGYLSVELLQVSIFLAAFSGMYFTVAAITDEVYRAQFFTTITRELDRAVAARAVYHHLKAGS